MSKSVCRYSISPEGLGEINIDSDPNGEWVLFDDIKELLQTTPNTPSVEISALLDRAFDLAFNLPGNAELLGVIRQAQKLSHVG